MVQYDAVDISTASDMLIYIHDNYLSFLEFDNITNDALLILSKSIYEILFVDFINDTIPQICNVKKLNSPLQLVQANSDEFKIILLEHYNNTLKQLNTLFKINPSLTGAMIKNSFAIDLFNTELTQFYEQFVVPVITKYQDQIRENY